MPARFNAWQFPASCMRSTCTPIRLIAACIFLGTGICGLQHVSAEEAAVSVEVADAVTYVNLAKVNLTVGKMTPAEGNLLGTYWIKVPLLKSQSETGRIVLPMLKDVDDYVRSGGSLSGKGTAEGKENGHRKIDARFGPYDHEAKEGLIELTIDTGARILVFKSTYHLRGDGLIAMN